MKRITLTFDNGPHLTGTPYILDVLAERALKATFFVVAEKLRQPPLRALAAQAKLQGHRIANHTMTHGVSLGRRSEAGVAQAEIGDAQALLDGLAEERLFRPSGEKGQLGEHLLSEDAVDYLVANRFTAVSWNCVPQDWVPPSDGWLARAAQVMQLQDWSLFVLHDHCTEAMRHLGAFLDGLIAAGYEFSQDFPPDSLLIDRGHKTGALTGRYTPRTGG